MIPTARKKKEDIAENAIVQKSRPLFSLWKASLNLFEYKLLDLYLGKINSHDSSTQTVIITKTEFEKILGTSRLHSDLLDQRLQRMVRQIDIDEGGQYPRHVALFQNAYLNMNTDPYQIELECSNKILDLIFNIEKVGYFKYKLRNILQIESLYSYILFNYLEYHRQKQKVSVWEVDVEELKEILNCNSQIYSTFKRFNDLVLKKCHAELTAKTELRYNYDTVKCGRRVVAIRFELKPLSRKILEEQEPITIEAAMNEPELERLADYAEQNNIDIKLSDLKEIYYTMQEKGYSDVLAAFKRIYHKAVNNDPADLKKYIIGIIKNDTPQSPVESAPDPDVEKYKVLINKF